MTNALSERVATLALDIFSKLPARCKPRTLPDGLREWTPMSAIALSRSVESDSAKVVSLATGTKSLPVSALAKCNGLIIHDSHAEILALRGFNYWLLTEIQRLVDTSAYVSDWLESTSSCDDDSGDVSIEGTAPYRFRKGVEISLFSTEAPCGDASMELLMSATAAAGRDITPWAGLTTTHNNNGMRLPPGRGCFNDLGALRRKPARADAEVSMSKSCTDKLMLKQFTSVLSFPVDLLMELNEEVFLKRMIVYNDRWDEQGYRRAFSAQGRLQNLVSKGEDDELHQIRFFDIETLPESYRRFEFEKAAEVQNEQKSRASNISALWIAKDEQKGSKQSDGIIEVLLNGVKQGFKQFDDRERKGSVVCRRNMVQEVCKLKSRLASDAVPLLPLGVTADLADIHYSELKSRSPHAGRAMLKQRVLAELGEWPQKVSEDDFVVQISTNPI